MGANKQAVVRLFSSGLWRQPILLTTLLMSEVAYYEPRYL